MQWGALMPALGSDLSVRRHRLKWKAFHCFHHRLLSLDPNSSCFFKTTSIDCNSVDTSPVFPARYKIDTQSASSVSWALLKIVALMDCLPCFFRRMRWRWALQPARLWRSCGSSSTTCWSSTREQPADEVPHRYTNTDGDVYNSWSIFILLLDLLIWQQHWLTLVLDKKYRAAQYIENVSSW